MLKFICPSCHTENVINEGAGVCMCAGCSLMHRFVPERKTHSNAGFYRENFEHSFMSGHFDVALEWANKYDAEAKTIPSHYIKACISAIVNNLQPSDELVEQFILFGFEGHRRMMAWKVIDTWLKTQTQNKYYSLWLLALSDFQYKHKAILSEDEYRSVVERRELERVLTPVETYGLTTSSIASYEPIRKPLLQRMFAH